MLSVLFIRVNNPIFTSNNFTSGQTRKTGSGHDFFEYRLLTMGRSENNRELKNGNFFQWSIFEKSMTGTRFSSLTGSKKKIFDNETLTQ